jgi:hypothetical protein
MKIERIKAQKKDNRISPTVLGELISPGNIVFVYLPEIEMISDGMVLFDFLRG